MTLKDNTLTLEKTDKTILNSNSNLTHNDVITVKGTVQSGNKEKNFIFCIKIIDPDQKKVDDAVRLLQTINNEEVGLTDSDLINETKIKTKIKALQKYINAIKNVVLEKNITLKNASGANITTVSYQNIVTVQGTVKSGSKAKNFTFTVRIIDADQKKIDQAVRSLQTINNEEIGLSESDLTDSIAKLKIAIKTLTKYANTVKDEIILKEDNFIFEKSDRTVLTSTSTVAIDDVITVKGKVQIETKDKDFAFTIKIVDLDQQKVDNAVQILNSIHEEYIKLNSTDLNIEKLTSAIENLQEYQEAIKEVKLEGNLTFKKRGKITTTIANEDVITVKGKIKSGNKEKDFAFNVQIIDANLLQVDVAVMKLQFIKNEKIELLPTDLTVEKLKAAIKNLPRYQSFFVENIELKQDLTLEKIAGFVLDSTASVKNNDIITVKGIIKSGTVEKNFSFTVRVKENLTDPQKIDAILTMLHAIESNKEVELTASELTVAQLKTAIIKLKEYKTAFKVGVSLKPESIMLINSSNEVLSSDDKAINDEDMITVQGKIQAGNEERDFTFTIQVKEINEEKRAINNAITTLETIEEKVITFEKSIAIVTNLKNAIKNLVEYKSVVKGQVTLKDDILIFEKSDTTVLTSTLENNDVITVKGKVKTVNIEKDFTFTIKLQVTDYWFGF